MSQAVNRMKLRVGMVGMGMIFDETYRPFLENAYQHGIYDSRVAQRAPVGLLACLRIL